MIFLKKWSTVRLRKGYKDYRTEATHNQTGFAKDQRVW